MCRRVMRSAALDEDAGLDKVTHCQTKQLDYELKKKEGTEMVGEGIETFAGAGNLRLHLDSKQNSSGLSFFSINICYIFIHDTLNQ